jgi:hypothetical protein
MMLLLFILQGCSDNGVEDAVRPHQGQGRPSSQGLFRGLYNESMFHHLAWERKGSGQVRIDQHQLYSTSNFDRDKDREQNLK